MSAKFPGGGGGQGGRGAGSFLADTLSAFIPCYIFSITEILYYCHIC